jgi:hypothetical protein
MHAFHRWAGRFHWMGWLAGWDRGGLAAQLGLGDGPLDPSPLGDI